MNRYIISMWLLLLISTACAQLKLQDEPIAQIGNRRYTKKELDEGFKAYREYQKAPKVLSPADSLALYNNYWEELIAMNIYSSAIKDKNLRIDPKELEQEILKNPPDGVMDIPDLRTEGKFDLAKYQKALKERPEFKNSIMEYSRDVFSYQKLLRQIRSEVSADEDSVKAQWLSSGSSAAAKIIYFDYSRLQHIVASDTEIMQLYKENLPQYRRENGRGLFFVRFEGVSSRASAGTDKLAMAKESSDKLYKKAMEIGLQKAATEMGLQVMETPMFAENDPFIRMIGREPQLIAFAFANRVGTVAEPFTTPMGDIIVAEVAAIADEYYIPFDAEKPILTHRANSMKRMAQMKEYVGEFIRKETPVSYLKAAQRDSIRIVEQDNITSDSSFPPIGKVEALNKAILSTPEGEFTPLVQNDGFYYLAYITKRTLRQIAEWESAREAVLKVATKEIQDKHLDQWYLNQKAKTTIVAPR